MRVPSKIRSILRDNVGGDGCWGFTFAARDGEKIRGVLNYYCCVLCYKHPVVMHRFPSTAMTRDGKTGAKHSRDVS